MGRRRRARMLELAKVNATSTTTTTTPLAPHLLTDKLTIELCIHCHNYQHRLCWMLSSILQQKGQDLPNILVNISYAPGTGNPTTEDVCKFFREKGLNIKETPVVITAVSNRGYARNIQVKETTSDYMLFADSDLVYSCDFFSDLHKQIKDKLWNIKVVMGADRYSLSDQFCIKYFSETDKGTYPCEILNVAEIVKGFPVKWKNGRQVAPGFFQLARTSIIKAKGNAYVSRSRDLWRGTYSDRQFRKKIGGRIGIEVRPQYHLNHDRLGPEIQR